MTEQFEYLSPEWIEATRAIRGEYRKRLGVKQQLIVNYTITEFPFADSGTAEFHLDVASPLFYDVGHVDDPDFWLKTDYQTMREVYQDASFPRDRLREGYDDGTIEIDGDADVLRAYWADVIRDSDRIELFDRIMEITT